LLVLSQDWKGAFLPEIFFRADAYLSQNSEGMDGARANPRKDTFANPRNDTFALLVQ